jgi:hypothetical protein
MQDANTPIREDSRLAAYLRNARPKLIFRVEPQSDGSFEIAPYIADVEDENAEVIEEGYDAYHSPLGCPVYWRVVKRAGGHFYYSTFPVPSAYVQKVWGANGLSYCDPFTGMAVARIETRPPEQRELA